MSSLPDDALADLGMHIYMGESDAVMAWLDRYDPDPGYIIAWAAGAAAEAIKETSPPCDSCAADSHSNGRHFYGVEVVDDDGNHQPAEPYMQLVACALNDDFEMTAAIMSSLDEEEAGKTAVKLFDLLRQALHNVVALRWEK